MEDMTSKNITSSDIFECKTCGDCCTGFGGTYVSEKDIINISEYIHVTPEELKNRYLEKSSSGKYVIIRGKNGKCCFADKLCQIHPVKPKMCKAWPFIQNVIKNPENWNVMAGACPGIKKDIREKDLLRCVREERKKLES